MDSALEIARATSKLVDKSTRQVRTATRIVRLARRGNRIESGVLRACMRGIGYGLVVSSGVLLRSAADAVGPGKPPQRERPSVCGKTVEDGLKSRPDLRISWITTLARLDHGPYCCSCPKGPKDRQPERGCLHQAAGGRTRGSSGRFVVGPGDGLPTAGPLATRLEPSWRRASSRPPCRCSRQGSLRRSSLGHPGYSRRPAVLRRRSASPA